jgi:hypothetical protein
VKITRSKAQKIGTLWNAVLCGAAFEFEGFVYLKIEDIWTGKEELYNAVFLDSGGLALFDDDCFVHLVNAELIVTE